MGPRSTPEFEALTSFVTDNRAAREGAQLAVSHLQDPHGYNLWWLAHSDATYYMVEIEALVDLLAASEGHVHHLFLLDELFRGTNTVERLAAAHALLEELVGNAAAPKPHYIIAATHDGELSGILQGFEAFHFHDNVGPQGLEFDFRLRRGVATSRTAIELLRRQGAPTGMIDKAQRTADRLTQERRRPS